MTYPCEACYQADTVLCPRCEALEYDADLLSDEVRRGR